MNIILSHVVRLLMIPIVISTMSLCADWDPEYALGDYKTEDMIRLMHPGYQILKENVINALQGTWCSREKADLLMDLVVVTQPKVCVEIGACTGSSVLPIAATLKFLNRGSLYAIDAWSNEVAIRNLEFNDPNRPWWATVNMTHMRSVYDQTIQKWQLSQFCYTIQDTSEEAIKYVPLIDFLHLDGDYSEKGSVRDVELYLPNVKSGGYILLSNLFIMVNNTQPKIKAFCALFDSCELVCEIERDNAVLFRKN